MSEVTCRDMDAKFRSVKVGDEASYCTIVNDFQTSLSDFSLTVLYGQAGIRWKEC
jgi:hypothetical protein